MCCTGKRLLIVEDDYNTLIGLQELLGHKGYHVKGATCAAKAIQLTENESIDIVLCDYRLPDMDGNHLCRKLKQINTHLVIFIFTAYNQPELVDLVNESIVDEVFNKPLQLEDLYRALEMYRTCQG